MSEALLGSELDAMVNRYLNELAGALGRLPASERDHLVSEIREHIVELRSERSVRDRSDMEALLNRVGLPEDIAAVALEGQDDVQDHSEPVGPRPAVLTLPWRAGLSRRIVIAGAAGAVAFGLLLAAVAGAFAFDGPFHGSAQFVQRNGSVSPAPPTPPAPPRSFVPSFVTVPDVTGESQAAAEETMIGAGLTYDVTQTPSASVAAGKVIAQEPAAGSTMVRQRTVLIIVSSGPLTTS